MKGRAAAKGRNPDELVDHARRPGVVGDTDEEAREIEHGPRGRQDFDRALAELGRPFGWHDFRQYDLDAPFPDVALTPAERSWQTQADKIADSPGDAI